MKKLIAVSIVLGICVSFYGQDTSTKKTTICWDSSLSMKERDIEKEFGFLQDYFTKNQQADVTLLLFSNTIVGKEDFSITSGHWGLIKERLKDVTYDGSTSYSDLAGQISGGDILLFTDGQQNTQSSSPNFQGELTVINSHKSFNQANLNLLAIINNGSVLNLVGNQDPTNEILSSYFGSVQGAEIASRQIEITVKGKEEEVIKPEEDGSYKINANVGDIMIVSEFGTKRVEKVLGKNQNIDIWLGGTNEINLEEVTVTGIQEEDANEKVTAYGTKNEDAVGYAVQSITDEDISPINTTVNNAAQGKISGVRLGQNDDLSQVIMRPSNSILSTNYGLIVVDGVPLRRSDSSAPPPSSTPNVISYPSNVQSTGFLDPQNIANITVLKGLAATNRFGSLGANGVILITTKTATIAGAGGEKKDLALLTDNIYEGKLKVSSKTLVTPYLKALKSAKNLEEAYSIYLSQRDKYGNDPAFYIDLFDYFYASSQPLALRIMGNVLEDETSTYNALRAMLFKCQQHGLQQLELETANKIIERFPDKSQSYFDLAMALKNNGSYQESLDQLIRISEGNSNNELDFTGLKKSIDAEIKNLVYSHNAKLDLTKADPKYRNNLRYDARIIFDWNHPSSEFELQFVNPQKRFFTWEHTAIVNGDRLQEEWDQGYSQEEFEIVGEGTKGQWLINVKYLGNTNSADLTPTFLKCIVQYNFGKPGQREEVHLIRLHEKESEVQFLKIEI